MLPTLPTAHHSVLKTWFPLTIPVCRLALRCCLALGCCLAWSASGLPYLHADEPETASEGGAAEEMTSVEIGGLNFRVAAGWSVQRVADAPLVRYPVHADLAPDGRLFVVESSGSGAPVQQQLEERPHRLIVLEDSDGDGRFDQRQLYADGLMLPQGVLWTADGVLVATPPEIWRYHDSNGDGVADDASVWFDGKTLTGCANDLHGPFLGREGWVHWCKGAFAEQTYDRSDGSSWSTRSSHVLRMDPRTGTVESVMTGGMDNPVEFAMSLCGERFFTCTFIQHPADGKRDALVHAVYGGVYGKEHGVLQGHPRTGPLMPVMTHLGPAAPAGLTVRESALTDDDLFGELLVAQFNLQKVSRHRLVTDGAGLKTVDSDLLVADRPDFHPTDVIEDADGSLLVIDTGGWYTLCCPTSHIDQSEATGGIYRLTPPRGAVADSATAVDEANRPSRQALLSAIGEIDWQRATADQLAERLGDHRPLVRQQARTHLLKHPDGMAAILHACQSSPLRAVHATWALVESIGLAAEADRRSSLDSLATLLDSPTTAVRLVAAQGLGLHRDSAAVPALVKLLADADPRQRRYAAEALGRIGDAAAAGELLSQLDRTADDRVLEHALLYALIEIGDAVVPALRQALQSESSGQRMAALRVLDQLDSPALAAEDVLPILSSDDDSARDLASEIIARRPQWDSIVAERLEGLLIRSAAADDSSQWQQTLQRLLLRDGLADAVATIISRGPDAARKPLLAALVSRPPTSLPSGWGAAIATRLANEDVESDELRGWATLLRSVRWKSAAPEPLVAAFGTAIARHREDHQLWLALVAGTPPGVVWRSGEADDSGFESLLTSIADGAPPAWRQQALAALGQQPLSSAEASRLATATETLGPMELTAVLSLLRPRHDEAVNRRLLAAVESSPGWSSLPRGVLEDHFRDHPEAIRRLAEPVIGRLGGEDSADRLTRLKRLLDELPTGDPLSGFQVFRGSKAACSACHAVGYFGGRIGPDLTKIGQIRTDTDLLEAIVYPSASFVRSYESFLVVTDDGRAVSGLIADEDAQSVTLVTGIDQRVRIAREDIETLQPSPVSIMPAGLDQQLTAQELADLLAFLKAKR